MAIALVALLAAGLTFFSGFGLGTLLMPVFAIFFPVGTAIAATAVVHLSNNLVKCLLIGRHAHWATVWRFGLPAMAAAFAGAALLNFFSDLPAWRWDLPPITIHTTPLKLLIGLLIMAFSLLELWPRFQRLRFEARWMPAGGLLSGFFGGLSGHQGAFRSAFLIKSGLEKEAFVATGVIIAVLVDVARLFIYGIAWQDLSGSGQAPHAAVGVAVVSAAVGSWAGNRLLKKTTLETLHRLVGLLLAGLGLALALGWI